MLRRPSYVRPSVVRSQCSDVFSKTAWPIKAKFYVDPPWEGGTKVYIIGPGHIHSVSSSPVYSYMKMPRKQNFFFYVMPYRRACTFNLSLHLFVMIALLPQMSYTYFSYFWTKVNASKTARINPFSCRKYDEPSIIARNNTTFTIRCLTLLFVSNVATWLFIFLLCAGDIQPNPGPLSVASSSGRSFSSTGSNDIFSHLSLNHNLSFVQYYVQSIVNKLDIIQAELF